LRIVDGHAKGHLFLFEPEHVKVETSPGNFGALQLDDAAYAMLGVNDIITDIEAERLSSHC
jgi:hypothetical protein